MSQSETAGDQRGHTSKTWIGSASKNSWASTIVNSSSTTRLSVLPDQTGNAPCGTSSTLPHHLVSIPPNPLLASFCRCTSLNASDDSIRWIVVIGGDAAAGNALNVCNPSATIEGEGGTHA